MTSSPISGSDRVVVFGATGFTGTLVAEALVRRGIRPVLAGRRADALAAVAERIGAGETLIADARRPETVRALVGPGDVLASTVGPFIRYGDAAVEAAAAAGAHYLDPAGEGQFVRNVVERHGSRAVAAGTVLLPAFGFESVPGNLVASVALGEAGPDARALDVLYVCDPRVSSGGTRASAADVMLERAFAWQDGRLVDRRVAERSRRFPVAGRSIRGLSIPSSEHLMLPAEHPGLRDVEVYLGGFGLLTLPLRVTARISGWLAGQDSLRRRVMKVNQWLYPVSSGGPSVVRRERTTTYVLARARDAEDRVLSEAVYAGPDPYLLTAELFAWAADRIRSGGLRTTGCVGPVAAFGLAELHSAMTDMGLHRLNRPVAAPTPDPGPPADPGQLGESALTPLPAQSPSRTPAPHSGVDPTRFDREVS